MHTLNRTRPSARRHHRPQRLLRPVAGQCFEIEVRQDGGRWVISIPEIGGTTETADRPEAELAARRHIAAHTGIPLGYISVWVRD